MADMSRAQWKQLIDQWRVSGRALSKLRAEALRDYEHDPETVDSLLRIGNNFRKPRTSSGLVHLQRWLMRLAEHQGALPQAVHEPRTDYGASPKTPSDPL